MSASFSRLVIGLMIVTGSVACTYLTPYKIDIQQGNVVTPEAIEKLKVGMTKAQVGFVLGTPLLSDLFHANRWDYVYYLRKGGRVGEERKVRLMFEDSKLKQIDGDVVAAKAKDGTPGEAEKAKVAAPGEAAKAKDAAPSEAAKAKDAAPSEVAKAKDAGPSEAAVARSAEPSESEKAQDAGRSAATNGKVAKPNEAAKETDTEPGEPAPALNETKQP